MRTQPLEASLQTTGLFNEAYLRLADVKQVAWQHRVHFMAICAQITRGVLVDSARAYVEETAELGWRLARAWLKNGMNKAGSDG